MYNKTLYFKIYYYKTFIIKLSWSKIFLYSKYYILKIYTNQIKILYYKILWSSKYLSMVRFSDFPKCVHFYIPLVSWFGDLLIGRKAWIGWLDWIVWKGQIWFILLSMFFYLIIYYHIFISLSITFLNSF